MLKYYLDLINEYKNNNKYDLNKSSFREIAYKLSNNLIDINLLTILQKILILKISLKT